MTVYVVRHAHAGDRVGWTGDDHLRPLTEKGWRQAETIVGTLRGVERLLSSPYLRCRQTLEPAAHTLGLLIGEDERLVEGTDFADALALITAPGPSAAMSTHGDIVVELVNHLVRVGLVKPEDAGGSKASIWELEVEAGRVTGARYHPPPR